MFDLYIKEARKKASDTERYTVQNGGVSGRYVNNKLILIFKMPYSTKHKPVVYFNCVTHRFCNINGK